MLYALQPKQMECFKLTPLYRGPDAPYCEHIAYGGAAGGGKSYLSRAVCVAAAFKWPGSTTIIFRETEGMVMQNHVNKLRAEVKEIDDGHRLYSWNGEEMCIKWFNGSRTYFGYLRHEEDIFNYQGPEYDIMVFEEGTKYSFNQTRWLSGNRLRATVDGSRPFCLYPSNPGGKGHQWFKRLFIEKLYYETEGEDPEQYTFLQAKLADNQILMQRDPAYARRLDRLPSPWREWQRDGDFGQGAGAALAELNRNVHLIKPFEIPRSWTMFGAFDWGYRHRFSFGWYAVDPDGNVYKVDTVSGIYKLPHEIVAMIRAVVPLERLKYIVAGRDIWSVHRARGLVGPTLWDQFRERGMTCIPADDDRSQGLQNFRDYLAYKGTGPVGPDGKPTDGDPRFCLFDTPMNRFGFRQYENMVPVDESMEDVLKIDCDERGDGGDDLYDETRYGLMSVIVPHSEDFTGDGGSWSHNTLIYEYEKKMRVTDDVPPSVDPQSMGEFYG